MEIARPDLARKKRLQHSLNRQLEVEREGPSGCGKSTLLCARRQLDANEATVDNLRNSTLPALDLVGSYQLTGQGGPRRVPAGNSFEDLFGGAGGVIRDRIEAATASRELAERQLEAEESKFEVGLSTDFFVLQSQRDLATAQDAELRAILDYQRALIEFERTQRASLGGAGIALVGSATAGGVAGPAGAAPSGPMPTPQR